jgi:hypothetical protein
MEEDGGIATTGRESEAGAHAAAKKICSKGNFNGMIRVQYTHSTFDK